VRILTTGTDRPEVALVVPSRNRAALLEDCVNSLIDQETDKRYEVVVVDDGSTDDTKQRITRLAERSPSILRYLPRPPSGLNASRNAGADATTADVLAFIDDDALAPTSYVDALVEGCAAYPDVECFGGRIKLKFDGPGPRTCGRESIGEAELEKGDSDGPLLNAVGANLIVRRRALERVGRFKEDMALYGDEVEWQTRLRAAGGRVMYLADAWIWHRRLPEDLRLRKRVRRSFRKGTAYPQAAVDMNKHVSPWGGVRQIVTGLWHAARYGCSTGLVQAGLGAGHTLGALRLLLSPSRSAYVHWIPARRVD
jgi:GT2 family glycosyltransferase